MPARESRPSKGPAARPACAPLMGSVSATPTTMPCAKTSSRFGIQVSRQAADGHELAETRKRIKAAIAEIDAEARSGAVGGHRGPRSKLRSRARAAGAGRRGRRAAQHHLARAQSTPGYGYISEHTCDPLALLAALFPDRMLALVMAEVERMANDPLPMAQRAPRVAALEGELEELHRVEEALVAPAVAAGQPVHRSPSAPPAAVLGVSVADRASRAA